MREKMMWVNAPFLSRKKAASNTEHPPPSKVHDKKEKAGHALPEKRGCTLRLGALRGALLLRNRDLEAVVVGRRRAQLARVALLELAGALPLGGDALRSPQR